MNTNIYISKSHNPHFNLAFEEHLFETFDKNFLNILIYINSESVILGKNQNPFKETNFEYLLQNNIPIIRRFTGGGTVYHDLNNINYSFIFNKDIFNSDLAMFIIIDFLKKIGLNAVLGDKQDILIEGKKISGQAYKVNKDKALHHGTLLIDSNIDMLRKSLKKINGVFEGTFVDSRPSTVSKISNYIDINTDDFISKIIKYFSEIFKINDINYIGIDTTNDFIKNKIKSLQSYEWTFAYTNDFSIEFNALFQGKKLKFMISEGCIQKIILDNNETSDYGKIISKKFILSELSNYYPELDLFLQKELKPDS